MRQESSMGNLVLDHGAEWLWSGCYEVAILTINLKMLAFDLRTAIINGEAWIRLNIIQQQNMKGSSRENRKVMRDRMHVNVLCSDLNHRSFNRRLSQSLLWLKDEWMLSCYGNHDGEIQGAHFCSGIHEVCHRRSKWKRIHPNYSCRMSPIWGMLGNEYTLQSQVILRE
jgi:hypothetical protein